MKVCSSIFIFLTLIVSFSFTACGNLLTEDASITIDAEKVARYLGRNADTSVLCRSGAREAGNEDIYNNGMIITASTIGTYETSSENKYVTPMSDMELREDVEVLYKKASGTSITLDNIPVGARIKVKVSLALGMFVNTDVYRNMRLNDVQEDIAENGANSNFANMTESEILDSINEEIRGMQEEWDASNYFIEGVTETFTVRRGPNTITLRFGDDENIGIPIIVYSKIQGTTTVSIRENNHNSVIIPDASNFINFCTDGNGYKYILYSQYCETHGKDCCFVYSDNPAFDEPVHLFDGDGGAPDFLRIAYDEVEKKIYSYSRISNNDYYDLKIICFPKLISEGSVSDSITYTSTGFYISGSIDGMLFAVNNNIAYVGRGIYDNRLESLSVYQFNLLNGSNLGEGDFVKDLCEDCDLHEVKDTYYKNGNLYILVENNFDSSKVSYVYRGGLICLNPASYTTSKYLFSEDVHFKITTNTEYDFSFPQPVSQKSKDSFFCPKKIIGIKPKRLIIADDGLFLFADNDGNPKYKNTNRIVMVNLDSFKITSCKLTDEAFDNDDSESYDISTLYGEGFSFECAD